MITLSHKKIIWRTHELSKLEECQEFCRLINVRDNMAYLRGRSSPRFEKTLNQLNKVIDENFDYFFGDKSEFKMRFTKTRSRTVIVKKPYEVVK